MAVEDTLGFPPERQAGSGKVFILGAGFSKAISDRMPTLAQLSALVQSAIKDFGYPPVPGHDTLLARDFERWLSYLADSAPWLDEGDTQRNLGAFADVAAAISGVLNILEYHVLGDQQPDWLIQLVKYWQATSSTVITFNYDTLVELAWLDQHRDKPWHDVYPVATTPAAMRTASIWGSERPSTGLRLIKLHGSLNWFYTGPSSPPGDIVYDVGITGPWDLGGVQPRYERFYVTDKRPFIIPPAAVKSPYYANQTLRALWYEAAGALSDAAELILMGFSLPPTDQLVSAMLTTRLRDECLLIPVDIARAPADRLHALFDDPHGARPSRVVDEFAGRASAIRDWIAQFANIAD